MEPRLALFTSTKDFVMVRQDRELPFLRYLFLQPLNFRTLELEDLATVVASKVIVMVLVECVLIELGILAKVETLDQSTIDKVFQCAVDRGPAYREVLPPDKGHDLFGSQVLTGPED